MTTCPICQNTLTQECLDGHPNLRRHEDCPTCPTCGQNDLVAPIGSQLHCSRCGVDYAFDRLPLIARAQERKGERSTHCGWPERQPYSQVAEKSSKKY